MHLILASARARLSEQDGFAMVAVMLVMMVATLTAIAAVEASNTDRPQSTRDRERKQAYAAAEAGLNDYISRLNADVNYWQTCPPAAPPAAPNAANPSLNERYPGSGGRHWATLPGSSARYSVEMLPGSNPAVSCASGGAVPAFIDASTGTFKVRSTGEARDGGERRSIVATFRRQGFLDFVYFTDYETPSPDYYKRDARGLTTVETAAPNRDIVTWARDECVKYYRDGGQRAQFVGTRGSSNITVRCGQITFVGGDNQNGPFHTNDEILVSGAPRFGRNTTDDIEVSAPEPPSSSGVTGGNQGSQSGWRGSQPAVNDPLTSPKDATLGIWRKSSPLIEMPPSNGTLRDDAAPAYRFIGNVTITLAGTNMTVTGMRESGTMLTNATVPMPADGVVFVGNDPNQACGGYDPWFAEELAQPGCGNVRVSGDYDRNLTITAENDIIVTEDVTHAPTDDVMLGLIADQWVRVAHPVNFDTSNGSCTNNGGSAPSITIEAAILAVNDSFTVDRYWCGGSLGTLTVTGTIAQRFRGIVGQSGGAQGYLKNYNYDNRLRFRSPPRFLDPVRSSWRVRTQVEQVPAT